jgi:hypothetical protein
LSNLIALYENNSLSEYWSTCPIDVAMENGLKNTVETTKFLGLYIVNKWKR